MVYNHYGGEPLFIFYYIRFIGIVLLLLCRKIRERKDIKLCFVKKLEKIEIKQFNLPFKKIFKK